MRTRLHPSATRPGQIAWLTALLLLLGTACGDSQPEAQPGPPKAPEAAEATPPPAADPAPDGTGIEELIGAGMIPDGFPDDMPLFPAAEASNWMAPPGAGTLVLFDSSASPDEVFAFLRRGASGPGLGDRVPGEPARPARDHGGQGQSDRPHLPLGFGRGNPVRSRGQRALLTPAPTRRRAEGSEVQDAVVGREHGLVHRLRERRVREDGRDQLGLGRLEVACDSEALDQLGHLGTDQMRPQ